MSYIYICMFNLYIYKYICLSIYKQEYIFIYKLSYICMCMYLMILICSQQKFLQIINFLAFIIKPFKSCAHLTFTENFHPD